MDLAEFKYQHNLIVLAGGQSRRMLSPKALLPVPPRNVPLLQFVTARLARSLAVQRIILVANDPAIQRALDVPRLCVVPDRRPNQGPLQGLASGLEQTTGWSVAIACDMPYIKPAVPRWLLSRAMEAEGAAQAIVPVIDGQPQPLLAAYHAACLPAMQAALRRGQRHMTAFWTDVKVRPATDADMAPLDPRLESFRSLNTPQDWIAFVRSRAGA